VRGRVASLLEVGTGFHPELTGRENIFLNGAILGMSRVEIRKKFDEIVSFAEVERFLDTPVKRYSSGMHVRLAFAVAAHLDPEVLVIDEVLAVGDASFQKKSLGKMHSVAARENRTVLFVSHNLQAVQSLCDRAILLESGMVDMNGAPRAVVAHYVRHAQSAGGERVWPEHAAPGNDAVSLLAMRILCESEEPMRSVDTDKDFFVELEFKARRLDTSLCVGFDLANSDGVTVLRSYQTDSREESWPSIRLGRNRWRCKIPRGLLNGGNYFVNPRIGIHNLAWVVYEDATLEFRVNLKHGLSPLWNAISEENRPGLIAPLLNWTSVNNEIRCANS
jgi:lipopolysaccharide transport system ATP-binding protein